MFARSQSLQGGSPHFFVAAVLALAGSAMLASCAPVERSDAPAPDNVEPPVNFTGEPQNCIQRSQIRQTLVRSDEIIDFEMRGGDLYRVVLPNSCPGLRIERAFTYDTEINQLCSAEIIYVLEQIGGTLRRGAGCSLGPFIPAEYLSDVGPN